jgi:hypothetical protein
MLLKITGSLDFIHRPVLYKLETRKHDVSETVFPSSDEGCGKTPTLLGPLERANLIALSKVPNKVGAFPPPPLREDGNRSNFRNVMFCSFYNIH